MLESVREEFNQSFTRFYDGFIDILPEMSMAILVLLVFLLFARLLRRVFRVWVFSRLKDPVIMGFVVKVIQWVMILVGVSIGLKILNLDGLIVGIFSGAGVLAIILGFAFKDIGENFIAGMILAFNRPFKQGDLIMLGDQRGRVEKMTIRETQIKTIDGKDVFIPNASILKGNLINYTVDGYLRYEIELAVEEGSDVREAFGIILNKVRQIEGVLESPEPNVFVSGFGSSTFILQYTFWIDLFDPGISRLNVRSVAHYKVWQALDEAGFNLPGDVTEFKNFKGEELAIAQRNVQKGTQD